jgi:cell wall-associated NlpC family hydrolase
MANKLLDLAKTKLGCGYVWGSQGEEKELTSEILNNYIKTFGRNRYVFHDSQGVVDASKWLGKQVFDCSGLIVYCLRQLGYIKANQDYNAEMFYNQLCTPITQKELKEGDLVFIKNENGEINHIGVYADNGMVVEAMGTRYGVMMGHLDRFNLFGRLKFEGLDVVVDSPAPDIVFVKTKVTYNGKEIQLDEKLINLKGRIQIPVRKIVEALGFVVRYNPDTDTVEITDYP